MEFLDDIFEKRKEHTVGGAIIGSLRDVVDVAPKSEVQETLRARSNDQTAGFLGDTAAFLPALKWTAGGAIKATLMIDPHATARENAGLFVKNFAEGAALNVVGKAGMSDGVLGKYAVGKFGQGLTAEVVTHLGAGVGLGAIKTGFDVNAWKDKQGNFSALAGAENIAMGSAFTGVLNVPAQMVGLRVGKASTMGLARSPQFTSSIAAITSGYASGTVFGGVEAFNAGKNFTDTLKDMNHAGLAGAFTGLAAARFSNPTANPYRNIVRSEGIERVATPEKGLRGSDEVSRRRFGESAWTDGTLDINPIKDRAPLSELNARITSVRREIIEFYQPKKGAKTEGFKDYDDFLSTQKLVGRPVHIYKAEGHNTEIIVPESLVGTLEQLRALRLITTQDRAKVNNPTARAELIAANKEMVANPNKFLALPEDFVALLDELPHRGLVKRIFIMDGPDHANPYSRQKYKTEVAELERTQGKEAVSDDLRKLADTFKAAASASPDGDLTFFQPKVGDALRSNMFHEWAHLVKYHYGNVSSAFDIAKRLENYHASEYSKKNNDEDFAVHFGEQFTLYDADEFAAVTSGAPLKSSVFAHALMNSMRDASATRGLFARQFANRIAYTEEQVLPRAYDKLDRLISGGTDAQRKDAISLYGFLGSEKHIPRISQIAKTSHHPEVAQEALGSAFVMARTPEGRFQVLFDIARSGGRVQEEALLLLEALPDPRAKPYGKFIEMQGDAKRLPDLVKLVNEMPDTAGKEMAFEAALRLANGNRNVADAVAIRVMQNDPALRAKAFEVLASSGSPETIKHIDPYTRHSNQRTRELATETINQITLRDAMPGWEAAIARGSERQALDAVDEISAMHDNKLIVPLLKATASDEAIVRARAIQALGHYSPAMVKFHARAMTQLNPQMRHQLDAALKRAL